MPIYIVRWPDLSASLVRAEGEDDLLDILDQVGNPDDCEWSVYNGPLFIDFLLPVEWSIQDDRRSAPVEPDQVIIGDVGRLAAGNVVETMQLRLAEGNDGYETGMEVLRLAFPKLHAAIERFSDGESIDGEEALPEPELRKALYAELERFLQGCWKRAQLGKKTDAVSRLAREMDLPVGLARKYEERAREQQAHGDDGPEPSEDWPAVSRQLLRVSNHHTDECGQPPAVDGDEPGMYYGYFANEYGEQAVFMYHYENGEAFVRMGDAGWGTAHRVVDGRLDGITVTEAEAAWVHACWLAATSERPTGGRKT